MNRRSTSAGFTRNELLVALIVTFAVIFVLIYAFARSSRGPSARQAASTGRGIHALLNAWAADHNGQFPVAFQSSNEAFRQLFKAKLVDDEKAFAIAKDAWHKNSPSGDGKGPDNDIGTAPDFQQALMVGECAWAYVTGHDGSSNSQLPILANAFSEAVGVYSPDKTKKGGVFEGQKAAWVTVNGSARVTDLSSDYKVLLNTEGRSVDVFGREWGTNPDNVKNPW